MSEGQGKKNDSEKPRMDLVSSKAMIELARVLTFGARKYASHNWRQGLAYSRIIAAIMRHVNAYNDGETNDPETGLSHMAHVMCEAMFLLEFEQTKPELDDRYRPDPTKTALDPHPKREPYQEGPELKPIKGSLI